MIACWWGHHALLDNAATSTSPLSWTAAGTDNVSVLNCKVTSYHKISIHYNTFFYQYCSDTRQYLHYVLQLVFGFKEHVTMQKLKISLLLSLEPVILYCHQSHELCQAATHDRLPASRWIMINESCRVPRAVCVRYADVPSRWHGQMCHAGDMGRCARQVTWADVPRRWHGQMCQASDMGRCATQVTWTDVPRRWHGQMCHAGDMDKCATQVTWTDVPRRWHGQNLECHLTAQKFTR